MKKYFILFLICIIINISFSNQMIEFEMTMDVNSESKEFYINKQIEKSPCQQWTPSLFNPTLLIPKNNDVTKGTPMQSNDFNIKFPFINQNKIFLVRPYEGVPSIIENYDDILLRTLESRLNLCYFGLSPGINIYKDLNKEHNTLNNLKTKEKIKERIFSFTKWDIKASPPTSKLYLGESQNIFNSNKGIIGTCESYPNDSLWGCSFKEMIFNNINIPLKNESESLYKIYFASEIQDLYFPKSYQQIFTDLSKESCDKNTKHFYLECKNFFNSSNYVSLQLTEENEKFIIKGQVDNLVRFSNTDDDSQKDMARIRFEDIDYIILPLMVFKEFHVQFDAENSLISFYTENSEILEVKEKGKNKSSSIGTVLIIILIILVVLGLIFAAYWFFIKRRKSVETNINTFSKFEDEDNYNNLNGKKVFELY